MLAAGLAISAAVALAAACGGSGTVAPATATRSATAAAATSTGASGGSGVQSSSAAQSQSSSAGGKPAGGQDAGAYAAGKSAVVADDVYPQYGDPATDVLHYGLDLKWDPAGKVLNGTATLTIRAAKPTSAFALDLVSGMATDSVKGDGVAGVVRVGDKLTVNLARQLPADATATVVIVYHGTPRLVTPPTTRPDIQGLGAQVTATGAVWAQQEPYGAFTWFPCNDQPSDKALYDVTFTVPDGWAGVTGGAFVGRTESGGYGVYKWHQPDPVATYLVALGIDQYKEETATGPHGLPITYWYLPADADAVHKFTANVPEMISFLEQRFGPYPFPTAGVMFRPEMVGMETQTMITLSTHIGQDDLLHEFAHQWFGDAVTPTTWSGLWLNEGFAMYSQFMWDVAHGQRGAAGTLDDYMSDHVLPADQALRTQDGPPGHYKPTHFASTNVYFCPALMLHGLHDALGDKAFYQLLNDWVHQHRDTNQDRAAFIAFVKKDTGKDYGAYIDAWLDSPTTPTITPDGAGSGPAA
ncbi:M1 family metallopeptidase [Catenulispora subtropica]|uniref:Aminopeptidase N n=1 Tax=Catenulispora subtropica TaxID=450798 RepID=A0ABP5E9N7_9ACTN